MGFFLKAGYLKQKFKEFSTNHEQLYCLFLFVLMLTNTVLLFTEKMNVPAKVAFIVIPIATQMILLAALKRPGVMMLLLIPKIIIDAFQLVLLKLYGGSIIAVDMWLNLVTTNATEAGELLGNIAPMILFLIVFYIPALFLAVKSLKNKEPLKPRFRKRALRSGFALLAIGIIATFTAKYTSGSFKLKYDLYPNNVFYNMGFAIKKWHKSINYPNTSKEFRFNAKRIADTTGKRAKGETYILLLGETARADNWSLFGYERNTTPKLDTMQSLIKFRDALTQSNTTHKSVPLTLTPADANCFDMLYSCKSIVNLFKEAGFKTVYLTNHEYRGTFMEHYFQEADVAISVKDSFRNSNDFEMLSPLFKELECNGSDLFIVVHLYGSHFNYHQRYTREFAKFTPDIAENISKKYKQQLINSYDNSILSTDSLIDSVINMVGKRGSASAVMYLSDHGEDLLDDRRNRFLHASPIPTYYQLHVPFVMWLSPEYIEAYPSKAERLKENSKLPVSTTPSVFHTFADLASIGSEYVNLEFALSSDKYRRVPRRYITDHDGSVKISELLFTKYDYEEFRENNIELD